MRAESPSANALEQVAVIALAPADRTAVLRLPSGELRVVAVGDELPDLQLRVRAIARDHVTVDVPPAERDSLPRRAWLDRSKDGKPMPVRWLARESPLDQTAQPVFVSSSAASGTASTIYRTRTRPPADASSPNPPGPPRKK